MAPMSIRDELLRMLVKQGPLVLVLSMLVYYTGTRIVFPLVDRSLATMANQEMLLQGQSRVLGEVQQLTVSMVGMVKQQVAMLEKESSAIDALRGSEEKQMNILAEVTRNQNQLADTQGKLALIFNARDTIFAEQRTMHAKQLEYLERIQKAVAQ